MAILKLRNEGGKSAARKNASGAAAGGSSVGGTKATAKFKKGGRGRTNGGTPYSGAGRGTGESDSYPDRSDEF